MTVKDMNSGVNGMKRERVLLGATKNHEIVFGEFEITERNGYPKFSASFDTVRPFYERDVNLEDYFEDYADPKCMGAEYVVDMCNKYDCPPKDLPKYLADECDDPRDVIDCSLYPEEMEIDGEYSHGNWYFESCSCGQHDTRNEMEIYVDKSAYEDLIALWDAFHLKNVGESVRKRMETIVSKCNVDEEEWIRNYILQHENELRNGR